MGSPKLTSSDLLSLSWLGLLYVVIIYRAWLIQITPDEAYTYNAFIQPCRSLMPWLKWEANNHLLNTILSSASVKLFGLHPFTLRLANVLAWPVFAGALFQLTRATKAGWTRLAIVILVSGSSLLLDLASLSRGYGLSMAFMMVSLLELRNAIAHRKHRPLVWLIATLLMLLANLNLLPFALLSGLVFFFYQDRRRAAFLVGFGLMIAAFVGYGFQLKASGLLYFGGTRFWSDTVWNSAGAMYGSRLGPLIVIALLALGLFEIRSKLRYVQQADQAFGRMLFLIFIGLLLVVWVQHLLLETPFPTGRTAMHLWILLPLAVGMLGIHDSRWKSAFPLLALGALFGTFKSWQWDRSTTWADAYLHESALDELADRSLDQAPSVGSVYPYTNVWTYLQKQRRRAIIPQRITSADSYDNYDVLLLNEPAVPEGFEPLVSSDIQSNYRFYVRSQTRALIPLIEKGQPVSQTDLEFYTIADTVVGKPIHQLHIGLGLELSSSACGELYLVIKDRDNYEQIDVFDIAKEGHAALGISRVFYGTSHNPNKVSMYLWNPEGLTFSIDTIRTSYSSSANPHELIESL